MERFTVLVVDDEEGMRKGVERVLGRNLSSLPEVDGEIGFDVQQASTGEEALALLADGAPDILLLDHMLPGITGIEVMEEAGLRGSRETLVIMISAYASIETALKAAKRGAYDFLAKPFTPEELKSAIGKAVERIQLERRARKLAAEKRRVRFEFISVLAHELKAPLGAIEGYVNMLRDATLGPDVAGYEQVIDRCLARSQGMRKLIYDLLDLTRIESGDKSRELASLDLTDVARSVIETLSLEAAKRSIALDMHAEGPVTLIADQAELTMLVTNLVSNAIKYNRDGGRVDVLILPKGRGARIEVSDTGIGMMKEQAARLFNEFVRIKTPKTRDILGSGLGLSIVKKIALLYGGEVSVQSEPDVGSTFTVILRETNAGNSAKAGEGDTNAGRGN